MLLAKVCIKNLVILDNFILVSKNHPVLMHSAYNGSDDGDDVYEKTLEELKRERDRNRYANMSAEKKKEKITKKNLARTPNHNIQSGNLNDEGN